MGDNAAATGGLLSGQRTSMANRQSADLVLYRVHPNGGLVFADATRARRIARIHKAITKSSTWGAFLRAMPRDEYSRLVRELFDDNEEPRPRSTDDFNGEQIPAYCDGDYPAWLQQEMDSLLPQDILRDFAIRADTSFNGCYWHIDPMHLKAIKQRLAKAGFVAKSGARLTFY